MTERAILVTGASGLLGAHVAAAWVGRTEVVGVDRHPWWGDRPLDLRQGDLLEPGFVEHLTASVNPGVILHCAALVDVDRCEQDPVLADAANGELTRRVARAAPVDCLVVYLTTDGVFAGGAPWMTEDRLPCPRTAYGRSKLRGEWEVQLATPNHLIIRTNFYGWSSGRKQSSAEWLHHALVTQTPITAFDDFFFTPIYVVDFVDRLRRLVDGGHRGLFQVCGRERVSKYDFVMAMADMAQVSADRVQRGSIEHAGLLADRPRDMSLSSDKFCCAAGVSVPGCREGLRRFLAHRGSCLSARFAS